MSALLNPPVGAMLACKRREGPFAKGERWKIESAVPHQTVELTSCGRCPVELGCGQLARMMAGGTFEVLDAALPDRERQLVALKVAAPLRSPAGRVIERQHNIDELPLFLAAQEPSLF